MFLHFGERDGGFSAFLESFDFPRAPQVFDVLGKRIGGQFRGFRCRRWATALIESFSSAGSVRIVVGPSYSGPPPMEPPLLGTWCMGVPAPGPPFSFRAWRESPCTPRRHEPEPETIDECLGPHFHLVPGARRKGISMPYFAGLHEKSSGSVVESTVDARSPQCCVCGRTNDGDEPAEHIQTA